MRMDILNRYLRSRGIESIFSTGVDAYESHVLLRAHQDNTSPQEICSRYANQIENDLKAASIDCDLFIDPTSSKWNDDFMQWNRTAIERIRQSGSVKVIEEQIPFGVDSHRYITGCWIEGECPICGDTASGYCCSACGYHFRPEELRNPRSRVKKEELDWVPVSCLYLEIQDIDKILQARPDYPTAKEKVLRYLDRQQKMVRLSVPGDWGVPIQTGSSDNIQQVVFTYTAIGFQLMVGDSYRTLRGCACNGFEKNSGITVVGGFGSDNVIPFLVGMQGGLVAAGYKPFDNFLINEMMYLEGKLFSTSRGHAIWVGDIINNTPMHSDVLRYYMAKISPEEGSTDLIIDELVDEANSLAERWGQVQHISNAVTKCNIPPQTDEAMLGLLEKALETQDLSLDIDQGVRIRAISSQIDDWLLLAPVSNNLCSAYWWLKGLCLLAYPLLPRWSQDQWEALGHHGIPRCETFLKSTIPIRMAGVRYLPLKREHLSPCLPDTLKFIE